MENEVPAATPNPVVEPLTPPTQFPVTTDHVKNNSKVGYILAAVVGFLVVSGAVFAYFQSASKPPIASAPTPVIAESLPELTLSITDPSIDSVAESETLTVAGVTSPNTPVIVMTETADSDTQSDDQGNFTARIKLAGGVNELTVTAFRTDGQEKTLTFEVVFDDQVLGRQAETGTVGTNPVTKTKPTKKIVKDTFDSVSRTHPVDKNTVYTDEKNQPVKSNTIKPGDRVMAIIEGVDGSSTPAGQIKKAIKIIARSATESAGLKISARRAIQGVVTAISDVAIQLTHQTQRDRVFQVLFNDQTAVVAPIGTASGSLIPALLQVGQRVIAVGNVTASGDIQATRIRIIPGKATGVFTKQPVTPYPTMTVVPTATATVSAIPTATIFPTSTPTPIPTPTPTTTPTL